MGVNRKLSGMTLRMERIDNHGRNLDFEKEEVAVRREEEGGKGKIGLVDDGRVHYRACGVCRAAEGCRQILNTLGIER